MQRLEQIYNQYGLHIDTLVSQTYKGNNGMEKIHNIAEVIVAKNRHGPISRVKLHFNASNTKFSDLAESSID